MKKYSISFLVFCFCCCISFSEANAQLRYFGVNLAGADFGVNPAGEGALPGTFGVDYIYPNQNEVDYFQNKGMNVVRLPFRWERLQPSINSEFDATELNRLKTFVDATTTKGVYVLLDPHNYARYFGNLIGSSQVPYAAFTDFWERLADLFKDNPRVIFGLMNEPSNMPTAQWVTGANAGIKGIRDTGATNLILVPGNGYTGGHSWLQNWYAEENPNTPELGPNGYRRGSNAEEMLNIVDPLNNYAFDVHQYLDSDFSGTDPICVSTTIGSEALASITAWLDTHDKKAFLGEFGAGSDTICLAALSDISSYVNDRPDQWIGWSYWAAGPWWGDYFSSLEPLNLASNNPIDRPQFAALVFDDQRESGIHLTAPKISILSDAIQISFLSSVGFNYQLQTKENLISESWQDIGNITSGNGSNTIINLPAKDSNEPRRFYRLKITE